ncbi:MAG TPA: c-type cytochrome [Holophagaceae bacterium]|nr:c-type cytochrome [Holophagaceae bacterium]
MPLRRLFAATSLLMLVVLGVSPVKNALRPYRALQRRYAALGASRATSLKAGQAYLHTPVAIHQIWLPAFENRVDRCTTCHLGVQDAVMKGAPEPFSVHPRTAHTPKDFDRFGCTSCHGGQGLATLQEEAHGTAREGTPMTPLKYIESGCGRCHTSEKVPGAGILSTGRALMDHAGCFACHAVKGHEGFRSPAPSLDQVNLRSGGGAIERWLADPKGTDPNATMPNFHLDPEQIKELTHYLFNLNAPAALVEKVRAAGAESAGDPKNGKKLFAESRCISCHTVEGKGNGSAPELSQVASRATRAWLLAFLRDPHAFQPATKMPQFGFSAGESRDVVAYLEDEFRDFDAPKDVLDPVAVNQTLAEKGEKLFRQSGCFACHGSATEHEKFGPELDGIGDKRASSLDFGQRKDLDRTLAAWLGAKLENPRSFATGLKMPAYGFKPEETQAVVTALLAMGARPPEGYRGKATTAAAVPLPGGPAGALIDRFRCLSCHQFGDKGGDISTAPLTAEGSKVKAQWLQDYLVVSYSIRPILEDRMPILHMTKEEAKILADTLQTFYLDPAIPEDPYAGRPAETRDPVEGKRLFGKFGCGACHITDTTKGYYGPPLSEAGKRLKPGWTYMWLKGPQRWRADVRCPNYGMDDAEALQLTAYLQTLIKAPDQAKTGAGGGR